MTCCGAPADPAAGRSGGPGRTAPPGVGPAPAPVDRGRHRARLPAQGRRDVGTRTVGLADDEALVAALRWALGRAERDRYLRRGRPSGRSGGPRRPDRGNAPPAPRPRSEVETAVTEGGPASVLRAQAAHAVLFLAGSDGLGRVGDVVLGGVVRGLAGHVDVRVVVVLAGYGASAPRGDHAPVIVADAGPAGCHGAWRFAGQPRPAPRRAARGRPVVGDDPVDRALVDRARGAEFLVLGVDHSWFHHRAAPGWCGTRRAP